jgi:hypothetical protein
MPATPLRVLAAGALITISSGAIADSVRSSNKMSGGGSSWSNWYQFCTPPLRENEFINEYKYHLEGDRHCGGWAECRLDSADDKEVCVGFRMQGHSEKVLYSPFRNDNGARESYMVIDYGTVQRGSGN